MQKTILITGATDGIGLITAIKLVKKGHNVLIHGRNIDKLKSVVEKLSTLKSGKIKSYHADFSNLVEVENFINIIKNNHTHIDIIINNAGVYKASKTKTNDNLDIRFAVNTLAPYLLTKRLLPLLDNTSRIINLSSAAQAPVDLQLLQGKYFTGDQLNAYAQSKLAITMWSHYVANNLGKNAPVVISVNPGSLLASKMVKEGFGIEGKDINIGADILIRTSLDDEFSHVSGLYFDNDIGKIAPPHPDGFDEVKCSALITVMDEMLEIYSRQQL